MENDAIEQRMREIELKIMCLETTMLENTFNHCQYINRLLAQIGNLHTRLIVLEVEKEINGN
jgi:hypothetical protein